MSAGVSIRPYAIAELPALTRVWNSFWRDVPRAFAITPAEFTARVLSVPGFAETTLLVAYEPDGTVSGFAHFGPREDWWFLPEKRRTPDPKTGVVYALCASDAPTFCTLAEAAESHLCAAGAGAIFLWPSWAQGAIPYYNGLMPSNEVSGLWTRHPATAWAQDCGYVLHETYTLGILPRGDMSSANDAVTFRVEPFPAPIVPGAMRLTLEVDGADAGHVVFAPGPERRRAKGINEWAAFDIAIVAHLRGQGLGKAMMHAATAWQVDIRVAMPTPGATYLLFGSSGTVKVQVTSSGTLTMSVPGVTTLTTTATVTDGAVHWVCADCVYSGGTYTYFLLIDNNVAAKQTGTPSGLSQTSGQVGSGANGMFVDELAIWTQVGSGLTSSTSSSATNVFSGGIPSAPYSNIASGLADLYHFDGNCTDSAGLADPPLPGSLTVSTSGGVDTVTATACTPQDGYTQASFTLLVGTSSNTYSAYHTTSGTGSISIAHTGTGSPTAPLFYSGYWTDSNGGVSAYAPEIFTGGVSGTTPHNFQMTLTAPTPTTTTGEFSGAASFGGAGYYTMPATANPFNGMYLGGPGSSWTVDFWAVTNTSSSTNYTVFGGTGRALAFQVLKTSGYAQMVMPSIVAGNTNLSTVATTTVVADGSTWHHIAIVCQGPGTSLPAGNSTITLYVDGVGRSSLSTVWYSAINQFTYFGGFPAFFGKLDELRVSSVARWTTTFTPPTNPYSNTLSGDIALFHFDASSFSSPPADTNGDVQGPSAPTISVSTSGGTDTITITGLSTAGSYSIGGYGCFYGTTSGGESTTPFATTTSTTGTITFTHAAAALGYTNYYTVEGSDTEATPLYGAASNEGFNLTAQTAIYADNTTAIHYSPGNWYLVGSGSGAEQYTNTAGAYLWEYFTGQHCTAVFDTSPANVARMVYTIDDGSPQQCIPNGAVNLTPTPLAVRTGAHLLKMYVQTTGGYSWFTTTGVTGLGNRVGFLGFNIDSGAKMTAFPAPPNGTLVIEGDSISMGYQCLQNSALAGVMDLTYPNDATMAWPLKLGAMLGMDVCVRGWATWGYTIQPFGTNTATAPPYAGTSTTTTVALSAGSSVSVPLTNSGLLQGSTNMFVGDNVRVDLGSSQETATIASIPDSTHIVVSALTKSHASGVGVTDITQIPFFKLWQGQARTLPTNTKIILLAMGENDQLHNTSGGFNNATSINNIQNLYTSIEAAYPSAKLVQLQYWDEPAYNSGTATPDFTWAAISSAVSGTGGYTAGISANYQLSTLLASSAFNFLTGGATSDATVGGTWSNSTGSPVLTSTSGTTGIAVHPYPGADTAIANYATGQLSTLLSSGTATTTAKGSKSLSRSGGRN